MSGWESQKCGWKGLGPPSPILPFPDGEAGWSLADRGGAISAVIFIFEQAGSLLLYPTRREELSGESATESDSLWRGHGGDLRTDDCPGGHPGLRSAAMPGGSTAL